MKNKVLAFLLAVLIPLSAFAQEEKTEIKSNLVGLGMSSELSNYLGNLLANADVVHDNADWLKYRNAADSANINVLRVDASDETVLNADSGDSILLKVADTTVATIAAASTSFIGDLIQSSAADTTIIGTSSVSADLLSTLSDPKLVVYGASASNSQVAIVEGSAGTAPAHLFGFKSRAVDGSGDTIIVSGDDAFSIRAYGADGVNFEQLGSILFESGGTPGSNDMPGQIVISTTADGAASPTAAITIEPDQDLLLTGDLYLADGQNLGFTAANGANTACDTTCTTGCVIGWDSGTSAFVGCGSALADSCTCTK